MRWDDVQVFIEIAQHGSLSGAARVLGVNHSTVYRRLIALEDTLGVKLFERDDGTYRLSEAGTAALPHARTAETAFLAFQRTAEGHDSVPAGMVRLTAPEALLPLLTPHLATFRATHPRIDLHADFGDRFFDLGRREADVALRPTPRPEEGVAGRRICGLAWTVYAPADADHPTTLPWGVYSGTLERLRASQWRKTHHAGESTLLTVNSVPAMQHVICASGCQALLPCFTGDPDPTLQRVLPPIDAAASALWLLVHPDLRTTARVRALLDHLWEAFRADADLFEGRRT